jgi:hypothetical protein
MIIVGQSQITSYLQFGLPSSPPLPSGATQRLDAVDAEALVQGSVQRDAVAEPLAQCATPLSFNVVQKRELPPPPPQAPPGGSATPSFFSWR